MVVAGTSSMVYPAAGLPDIAHAAGAYVVEVNPDRTPLSDRVDERRGQPHSATQPSTRPATRPATRPSAAPATRPAAPENQGYAFDRPTDVAVDDDGNLYVVDFGNDRIVKLVPLPSVR